MVAVDTGPFRSRSGPSEMQPMSRSRCAGDSSAPQGTLLRTRILRIALLSEGREQVGADYKTFSNPRTTIPGGRGRGAALTADGLSERP
jgi:hypothetical protein